MMHKNTALESIQFQKTDLFNEITLCMKSMRNIRHNGRPGVLEGMEVDQLAQVIFNRTGLSYAFIDNGYGFTAYTPILHNHIFDAKVVLNGKSVDVQDIDHHFTVRKAMKALNVSFLEGTVSLKNSKVTGFFSRIKCCMSIPVAMLHDKSYMDEELAALVLHEIGHSFTTFEYLSRSVSTNQALSLMQRVMDSSISYEDRKIVFAHAVQAERIKLDQDAQKLILGDITPEALTLIVINQQIEACRSELGASVYDVVSCEYLADQFAARHGAGRYLITVLDKWTTRGGSNVSGVFLQASMSTMLAAASTIITGLPVVGLAIGVMTMLLASGSSAYKESKYETEFIYDNDETRINRVKYQMVERLKDTKCPAEEKKFILSYLEEVEPIVKKYQGQSSPKLRNRIAFFFSKKHKYDFEFMGLQKDLESLGNSNLFVMSEKLKALQS